MKLPMTTPGRGVPLLLAILVAGSGVASAAADAEPIRRCSKSQTREFPTSGFNTDVRLQLCIHYDYANKGYWASATGEATDTGGVRKFDRFDLKIAVQRNNKNVLTRTYGHAREINEVDSGVPINDWARYFRGSRKGTFTADAVVTYDLDADGKGPRKWQLHGTPPIP